METNQKPRKAFKSLFRKSLNRPSANDGNDTIAGGSNNDYRDQQRTEERYLEAFKLLKDSIRDYRGVWGSFEFDELSGEPEKFDDALFKSKIIAALESRQKTIKDKSIFTKGKQIIESIYTSLSPLAKNFLKIAGNAQSIPVLNPYGVLCGGLLLLMNIADKELSRKEEMAKTLDFICRHLTLLNVVDNVPEDLPHRDILVNRALDVRSSSMLYLAIQLKHDKNRLGFTGKMLKTFFAGDIRITDTETYLKYSVEEYNTALYNMNFRIVVKMYEILKGTADLGQQYRSESWIENKFIVPYQQNKKFIGRETLLQKLRETLMDQTLLQDNHRVALYGMGGIGKTQTALAYAYTHRKDYDRVYWITAVDQTSLLSGYQLIAKNARIRIPQDSSPIDIAKAVILWLEKEQKWLLVIDNLDNITIIESFLPENTFENHTLITTRNPDASGIPAIGVEVPLLDMAGSIMLLSILSDIDTPPNSEEFNQAAEIVQDLEFLPLAIEQAAAYTKKVTGTFAAFRELYNVKRRDVHCWIPQGNRTYSHSVTTTWLMSFEAVQKSDEQAAKLLQLLAFLNPDCILIDFLVDGAGALDDEMRDVLMNITNLAKVLLELEKFSLIKWSRPAKTLSIHRLIQTVVKDNMSEMEWSKFCNILIEMSYRSFPHKVTNNTRPLCRLYQNQVILPLIRLENVNTVRLFEIMEFIGHFLRNDGKYRDAEIFHKKAMVISYNMSGADNPSLLRSMNSLSLAYYNQGKLADAAKLQEEVLQKMKVILGENHPGTLSSMNNLASTYHKQGKLADAAKLQEEVLQKTKVILGEDHPNTLRSMSNLASTHCNQGKLADAAKLQEQVLQKEKVILGEDHPDTLSSMNNLALIYNNQGKLADAAMLQEHVLQKRKVILGENHPATLRSMNNLASTYRNQGMLADAAKLEELLQKKGVVWGEDHPDTSIDATSHDGSGRVEGTVESQEEAFQK